ncbi:MAG: SMI1/KNR4 family protein [Planctomycetaceae bacterium]|nr:SMI1/KNR4 family protein [Planctomycetaceae bacterium]
MSFALPELPPAYLTFLESHTGEVRWDYDDIDSWELATRDQLTERVEIDGHTYPYIEQLRGFTRTLREMMGECTTDADENGYPFDRLSAGLAIGSNNGDVVYLDPADEHAVWILYLDGGDVERLESTFADWLENAEPEVDELDDDERDDDE